MDRIRDLEHGATSDVRKKRRWGITINRKRSQKSRLFTFISMVTRQHSNFTQLRTFCENRVMVRVPVWSHLVSLTIEEVVTQKSEIFSQTICCLRVSYKKFIYLQSIYKLFILLLLFVNNSWWETVCSFDTFSIRKRRRTIKCTLLKLRINLLIRSSVSTTYRFGSVFGSKTHYVLCIINGERIRRRIKWCKNYFLCKYPRNWIKDVLTLTFHIRTI